MSCDKIAFTLRMLFCMRKVKAFKRSICRVLCQSKQVSYFAANMRVRAKAEII